MTFPLTQILSGNLPQGVQGVQGIQGIQGVSGGGGGGGDISNLQVDNTTYTDWNGTPTTWLTTVDKATSIYVAPDGGNTSPAIFLYESGIVPSGYSAGTFTNQPTSGGSGIGLTVDYTCHGSNQPLSSISINSLGTGYVDGDIVNIDGGNATAIFVANNLQSANNYLFLPTSDDPVGWSATLHGGGDRGLVLEGNGSSYIALDRLGSGINVNTTNFDMYAYSLAVRSNIYNITDINPGTYPTGYIKGLNTSGLTTTDGQGEGLQISYFCPGDDLPLQNIIINFTGSGYADGDTVYISSGNASFKINGTKERYFSSSSYGTSMPETVLLGNNSRIINGNYESNNNEDQILSSKNPLLISSGSDINLHVNGESANIWGFNQAGQTIFPYMNVARGDNPSGNITGYVLNMSDGVAEAIITTPDGNPDNNDSQRLVINPGKGADGTSGEGGDIYLWAGRGGDAGGTGGDIKIRGGQGMVDGAGGYIRIEGGDSQANGVGGHIDIFGGDSQGSTGEGGHVWIYAGDNYGPYPGNVEISGGFNHTGNGGDVYISGGIANAEEGVGDGGNVIINSGSGVNHGNVIISTPDNTWTFEGGGIFNRENNLNLTGNSYTRLQVEGINSYGHNGGWDSANWVTSGSNGYIEFVNPSYQVTMLLNYINDIINDGRTATILIDEVGQPITIISATSNSVTTLTPPDVDPTPVNSVIIDYTYLNSLTLGNGHAVFNLDEVQGNFSVTSHSVDIHAVNADGYVNITSDYQVGISAASEYMTLNASGFIETSANVQFQYHPSTPADWVDPPPGTIQEAIDRLAAAVKVLNSVGA